MLALKARSRSAQRRGIQPGAPFGGVSTSNGPPRSVGAEPPAAFTSRCEVLTMGILGALIGGAIGWTSAPDGASCRRRACFRAWRVTLRP